MTRRSDDLRRDANVKLYALRETPELVKPTKFKLERINCVRATGGQNLGLPLAFESTDSFKCAARDLGSTKAKDVTKLKDVKTRLAVLWTSLVTAKCLHKAPVILWTPKEHCLNRKKRIFLRICIPCDEYRGLEIPFKVSDVSKFEIRNILSM